MDRDFLSQIKAKKKVYLIDPLAKDIDLNIIKAIFIDQSILKVFHSARQDIEVLMNTFNVIPWPIYDTQVAANFILKENDIVYFISLKDSIPNIIKLCGSCHNKFDLRNDKKLHTSIMKTLLRREVLKIINSNDMKTMCSNFESIMGQTKQVNGINNVMNYNTQRLHGQCYLKLGPENNLEKPVDLLRLTGCHGEKFKWKLKQDSSIFDFCPDMKKTY